MVRRVLSQFGVAIELAAVFSPSGCRGKAAFAEEGQIAGSQGAISRFLLSETGLLPDLLPSPGPADPVGW